MNKYVHISSITHDRLLGLKKQTGRSMIKLVEQAVKEYEDKIFWKTYEEQARNRTKEHIEEDEYLVNSCWNDIRD